MASEKEGLSAEALDQETAIPLPEREAMSLIEPTGAKLAPISSVIADAGQGIDERVIPDE